MGPPTFPATSRTCSFAQCVLADNHSTGNSRSHYLHTTWIRFLPDGGARFPTCPEARLATLSVVQDLAGSESDRKSVVDSFFISKPVFAYFHVAAVGLVQGYQTVARADLMAFFFAAKMAWKVPGELQPEFVTDAQYVCSASSTLSRQGSTRCFCTNSQMQTSSVNWRNIEGQTNSTPKKSKVTRVSKMQKTWRNSSTLQQVHCRRSLCRFSSNCCLQYLPRLCEKSGK